MDGWRDIAESRLYTWQIRTRGNGPVTSMRHVKKSDGKQSGTVYVAQSEFSARNIAEREALLMRQKGR